MNSKYNVVGGLFPFDVLKYKHIFRALLENRALLEIEEQRYDCKFVRLLTMIIALSLPKLAKVSPCVK